MVLSSVGSLLGEQVEVFLQVVVLGIISIYQVEIVCELTLAVGELWRFVAGVLAKLQMDYGEVLICGSGARVFGEQVVAY